MHQRTRMRRLALAFAVPAAAIGGVALTAHAATSSPTVMVQPSATDQPEDPASSAGGGSTTAAPSQTATATGTATNAPTRTPTATPSRSGSASAVPGVPGVPGPSGSAGASSAGRVVNCVKSTVPTPVTVKIANVAGKQALVDGDGCALYVNTQDTPQASGVDQQSQTAFPPARGPAQAGSGVTQANLGTFIRADGTIQATFFGHQLYYFSQDNQPGQAKGQGLDRSWFLIDPTGTTITG